MLLFHESSLITEIIENCPKNDFRVVCESLKIVKKHRESPQNNFRLIHKSPRIAENHRESTRINENHVKNKVFNGPRPNDTDA